MNAGSIEDHLIGITKPSIDRMLKMENPADCIALYTFYCYTKKWQKNNAVFATSEFAMKALSWGRDKFSKAKTQLKEAGFIEDIQRKDSTGKIIGWFVGVRFAQSATLGNFHTTEIPDCGKSGDKYLKLINEIPNTNKQIQEESSAVASHSSVELNQPNLFPTENTANAKESFATAQRNDPPTEANAKTTAARKKSPPKIVDEKFIAELQRLNPDKDVEREIKAAQTWLLSRPDRKYTRGFLANWVIRSKNIINPDKFHNNNSF
jgi:hypothetical protein